MTPRPAFISFDVSNDSRRRQVRRVLRDYGDWLQRSLWLALPISANRTRELALELASIVDDTDRLFVLRPCLTCLAEVRTLSANGSDSHDEMHPKATSGS